ncbi:ABC transporter substrate-binding protein [Pengzhenrongella phosphoraccumulans]|uniref:ABC transporter substrate-binding protein n=1 Tax=Pengzhenrongella phosphoraccumulans TaxID=3114394 RepID=UPI00388F61F0
MRAQRTAALLAATTMVVALGACANDSTTGTTGTPEPVTITFQEQFNDAQTAAIEKLVPKFEAENPGIKVELLRDNDDAFYDKLVTQITAGQGPDLVRVDPAKAPQYIASGWAVPLGDVVGNSSDYFPAALDAVTKDGELYGVPLDVEALALFYRSDLLAAAGYDAAPTTWAEFTEVANALTKDGNYGAALFGGWGAFEFYPWLWQSGAEMLNADGTKAVFNSPEAVSSLQLWVDLQASAMPPGMATAAEDEVKGPFVSGNVAMFTSGPWTIPALQEAGIDGKWAVAPMPAGQTEATVLGGMDLLVLDNSKHQEEAKTFIGWLMKDANVKQYYQEIGGLPAKVALFDDPTFADDPFVSQFKSVLEQAKSRPAVAASNDVDAALGEAVQAALAGTQTPKEALDAAVAKANEALSE